MDKQVYKPLRNFIISGTGKWVEFPLTSTEIDKIVNEVGVSVEDIKFAPVEKYYLDEEYEKAVHYASGMMDINLMNDFAIALKEYVETAQKNDLFKKLEAEGYIKIDSPFTTYTL